jgi:uracil-DNA glycosylase family 4
MGAEDEPSYPETRAAAATTVAELDAVLTGCRACPRLTAWREQVAAVKRRAFQDWDYWGRPVPGFGPSDAAIGVIGLAPAAHGGNRTGRAFTGDAAGDFLYAALHAVGLASQPTATRRGDGLALRGVRISMPVHCAPPENKPTPAERDTCRPWLARELDLLSPTLRVLVVLGAFAWDSLPPVLAKAGWAVPRPRPRFGHAAHVALEAAPAAPAAPTAAESARTAADRAAAPVPQARLHLLGCYHPSQRNTFTGTLTPAMLESVLLDAARLAGVPADTRKRSGTEKQGGTGRA